MERFPGHSFLFPGSLLEGPRQGSLPAGGEGRLSGTVHAMGSSFGASSTYVVIPRLPQVHDVQVAGLSIRLAIPLSFLFWGMDMIKQDSGNIDETEMMQISMPT